MKIAMGSDHRGYAAKERIKRLLTARGIEILDFGTDSTESCDYPDAAIPAAQSVSAGESEWGILCCGTGIGMSIAANKAQGVRASLCHDEITAEMARRHNDANMLCIPADFIHDDIIERVVDTWLNTEFEAGRHERRVNKISHFESHNGHAKRTEG